VITIIVTDLGARVIITITVSGMRIMKLITRPRPRLIHGTPQHMPMVINMIISTKILPGARVANITITHLGQAMLMSTTIYLPQ
jgi:hypothetical protein